MKKTLLEQLGLRFNGIGGITGLEMAISASPMLPTGMERRVRLKRLTFDEDLEITALFEMRIFEGDVDLFDRFSQANDLPPFVARERAIRATPVEIPRTTRDSFRDAQTGALVASDAINAIPELHFFQSMALPHLQAKGLPLTGSEPYLVVVYLMLADIIREKDALGEF